MKISELIKELEEAKSEIGDVEVLTSHYEKGLDKYEYIPIDLVWGSDSTFLIIG